ncbi:DUF1624 domain-containing protein [Adhaeribacter swui]|uniref:DUF1624 domain-containing protein n=1 Tax=Adhaeribacter swui TaxID=2086471 RepID=A0A7G7G4B6_9BACT|nr:heparan-alpha-glucosaminide N-acetyltransferase domain-containing protein [Adhaeribacter swui]QNF32000.1 DUF1624 domain-containing protein [Adhaeribacter swui]
MQRINAIDFARGLVMIIMALDHTRELLHITSQTQSPTDLNTTTAALFFTRWITHFCAPVFVFLAGTSAYLSRQRIRNVALSRRFLLSRGIWLVVLECTVVSFGIWFDLQFRTLLLQVIAVIGLSFIILALLLRLSSKTIGLIGLMIILGHNLLDYLPLNNNSAVVQLIMPLFRSAVFPVTPQFTIVLAYPLVPWLGIMLAGFGAGPLFSLPVATRKAIFLKICLATFSFFLLLRFSNFYGDPATWSGQKNSIFTFLSFINVTKYPPSLLFTCLTLSVLFLVLAFAEDLKGKLVKIITIYGRVPLFYYILHWYLLHTIMLVVVFLQGYQWADLKFGVFQFGRPEQPSGVGLGATYLIWFSVVVVLYPFCNWFQKYKASHPQKQWLRFL